MKILFTADWHIRGDRPRCRIDEDWLATQRQDIANVRSIADEKEVDEVWIMGDLFHQPRCATEAVVMVLDELSKFKQAVRILPGNHDLPGHNYENLDQCSLGIILKSYPQLVSQVVGLDLDVYARPFGLDDPAEASILKADIYCTHQLTFRVPEDRPIEGVGVTAQELLDKAVGVPLIVTGDYHHGYIYKAQDGRRVITPGCLNIQAADMADYSPMVCIYDTRTGAASSTRLPDSSSSKVVNDYLVAMHEKEERMEKVLEAVKTSEAVSLDFMANLEAGMVQDSPGVQGIIHEIMDNLNKDRK